MRELESLRMLYEKHKYHSHKRKRPVGDQASRTPKRRIAKWVDNI